MNSNLFISLGITVGVPAIIALLGWIIPKSKVIAWGKIGRVHGKMLSAIGNTKLGKKAMDSLEEGPITTILAGVMSYITEFGAGLMQDNNGGSK